MPANKKKRKSPPAAPLKKRLLHTFYLIQPILQFFVLIAMIGILGRCSPLAPSAKKAGSSDSALENKSQNEENIRAKELAEEELINSHLKEISNEPLSIVNEVKFKKSSQNIFGLKKQKATEKKVLNLFVSRGNKKSSFFALLLSKEQKEELFREQRLRIKLHDYLSDFTYKDSKARFLLELRSENEKDGLGAKAFAIVPDATFQPQYEKVELELSIALSTPNAESAFLEIALSDILGDDASVAALQDTKDIAIILE